MPRSIGVSGVHGHLVRHHLPQQIRRILVIPL
jgi:hypothetical protein